MEERRAASARCPGWAGTEDEVGGRGGAFGNENAAVPNRSGCRSARPRGARPWAGSAARRGAAQRRGGRAGSARPRQAGLSQAPDWNAGSPRSGRKGLRHGAQAAGGVGSHRIQLGVEAKSGLPRSACVPSSKSTLGRGARQLQPRASRYLSGPTQGQGVRCPWTRPHLSSGCCASQGLGCRGIEDNTVFLTTKSQNYPKLIYFSFTTTVIVLNKCLLTLCTTEKLHYYIVSHAKNWPTTTIGSNRTSWKTAQYALLSHPACQFSSSPDQGYWRNQQLTDACINRSH